MIYLASPYTHRESHIRRGRYKAACEIAAKFMEAGEPVFSPISHGHGICEMGDVGVDYETWQKVDERLLRACDLIVVLKLDGWERSRGISAELKAGTRLGLGTLFMEPSEFQEILELIQEAREMRERWNGKREADKCGS